MAADAQRRSFPTEDIRDGVYGGGSYTFAFTRSNRQLVEINLLNLDPVFSKSDKLQERGVVFLFMSVRSADPCLNVFRS
jgi:hypothetical protein